MVGPHPEWGTQNCSESPLGVHKACLNPLDEAVYQAIEVLLGEVAGIFPDEYLHVGGDEVNPSWWRSDSAIASYLEQEQLSTHDLQNQFLIRVCSMVTKLGRKAIGWDEVLHPQMPDCVVQNWRELRQEIAPRAASPGTCVRSILFGSALSRGCALRF